MKLEDHWAMGIQPCQQCPWFVPVYKFLLLHILVNTWHHQFFFFFWSHYTACGILVPQPGIEPGSSAVKAQSPNLKMTREFLEIHEFEFKTSGTSLLVQWPSFWAYNAGGPSSIPGQGTRSHMPQLRVHLPQLKLEHATTNTWCS